MLIDLREMESGQTIEADLCIIGAGPAGISLALEFAGTGTDVLVLESGGIDYDGDTQFLAAGENLGLPYWDLMSARLRYLGGSSNHWNNWCGELQDIDFEKRPWVPHSGWPFGKDELRPYYERARPLVGLGPARTDAWVWERMRVDPLALNPDLLVHRFWEKRARFARSLGTAYKADLEAARNIRVLLYANATNIQAAPDGRSITHVDVRTLEGKTATARARTFILACGGIENARMLLLSDTVQTNGLGNEHDLVGRFFMEHPDPTVGTIVTDDPHGVMNRLGDYNYDEFGFTVGACLSENIQRREGLLNSALRLEFTTTGEDAFAALARMRLRAETDQGWMDDKLASDLLQVVSEIDLVGWNLYRRMLLGLRTLPSPGAVAQLNIEALSEQSPNYHSRVTLIEERDALGLRQVGLDWRINEIDKLTLRRHAEILGAELIRTGRGVLKIEEWLLDPSSDWGGEPNGGFHHMGTTRMHEDPKQGVVDVNCRVHGIRNLYVAGSSVFPTGGYINPTFTLVALALRLADHLKEVMQA